MSLTEAQRHRESYEPNRYSGPTYPWIILVIPSFINLSPHVHESQANDPHALCAQRLCEQPQRGSGAIMIIRLTGQRGVRPSSTKSVG